MDQNGNNGGFLDGLMKVLADPMFAKFMMSTGAGMMGQRTFGQAAANGMQAGTKALMQEMDDRKKRQEALQDRELNNRDAKDLYQWKAQTDITNKQNEQNRIADLYNNPDLLKTLGLSSPEALKAFVGSGGDPAKLQELGVANTLNLQNNPNFVPTDAKPYKDETTGQTMVPHGNGFSALMPGAPTQTQSLELAQRDKQLDQQRSQFDVSTGLEREKLDWQKKLGEAQTDIERQKIVAAAAQKGIELQVDQAKEENKAKTQVKVDQAKRNQDFYDRESAALERAAPTISMMHQLRDSLVSGELSTGPVTGNMIISKIRQITGNTNLSLMEVLSNIEIAEKQIEQTGPQTDKDALRYLKSVISADKPVEVNIQLFDNSLAVFDRMATRVNNARSYIDKNGSMYGYGSYYGNTPVNKPSVNPNDVGKVAKHNGEKYKKLSDGRYKVIK